MTLEMRRALARLPYEEKLRRVAALIEFSRRFKAKQGLIADVTNPSRAAIGAQ